MELEVDVEGWPEGDWEGLCASSSKAIGAIASELSNPRLIVSVLFTSDAEVHTLNREWRDRDKPTNVLSFPMLTRDQLLDLGEGEPAELPPVLLGDIALAYETCAREADEKGVSLEDHASHLIIHGLLHLAGHDHVHSDEDARAMEHLETTALAKMGIADPYGDSYATSESDDTGTTS